MWRKPRIKATGDSEVQRADVSKHTMNKLFHKKVRKGELTQSKGNNPNEEIEESQETIA